MLLPEIMHDKPRALVSRTRSSINRQSLRVYYDPSVIITEEERLSKVRENAAYAAYLRGRGVMPEMTSERVSSKGKWRGDIMPEETLALFNDPEWFAAMVTGGVKLKEGVDWFGLGQVGDPANAANAIKRLVADLGYREPGKVDKNTTHIISIGGTSPRKVDKETGQIDFSPVTLLVSLTEL